MIHNWIYYFFIYITMFQFGKLINDLSKKLTSDTILVSPVNVAIIITIMIMVIIYFVTYEEIENVYDDQPLSKLWIKIGFFSFIGNIIILFLSNSNIENKYKNMYQSKANQQIIRYTNTNIEGTVNPDL